VRGRIVEAIDPFDCLAVIIAGYSNARYTEEIMSENSTPAGHANTHSGYGKVSKQTLLVISFSFLVPILVVIALVYSSLSEKKQHASPVEIEIATASRIQKIGSVQIQDANREARTGEQVFNAQCTTCHLTGAAGSPKFGDAAAWAPRIKTGFEALWNSALKGKNAMGAQGGGEFSDYEVARAVVYMANKGGAKFDEPKKPADGAK
jgi:cytochrome c5